MINSISPVARRGWVLFHSGGYEVLVRDENVEATVVGRRGCPRHSGEQLELGDGTYGGDVVVERGRRRTHVCLMVTQRSLAPCTCRPR